MFEVTKTMKYDPSEYIIEYICNLFGWWVYRLMDGDITVAWHLHSSTKSYTENQKVLIFRNAEELIEYAYKHRKEGES